MGFRLAGLANRAIERVFGETVTFTPQTGAPETIRAVVDREPLRDRVGQSEAWQSADQWTVHVRLDQLTVTPAQDDSITVVATGAVYLIRDVQHDGQGGATLYLVEQEE